MVKEELIKALNNHTPIPFEILMEFFNSIGRPVKPELLEFAVQSQMLLHNLLKYMIRELNIIQVISKEGQVIKYY